jgi:hypothetical protein
MKNTRYKHEAKQAVTEAQGEESRQFIPSGGSAD